MNRSNFGGLQTHNRSLYKCRLFGNRLNQKKERNKKEKKEKKEKTSTASVEELKALRTTTEVGVAA